MSYTKDQLLEQVTAELFALASGQTPNPDDTARIETRINATLAALAKTNAYYIPDSEEIDDAIFNALAEYLAQVCRPALLLPRDKAAERAAEDELRRIARMGTGTGQNLKVDPALMIHRRRSYFRIDT